MIPTSLVGMYLILIAQPAATVAVDAQANPGITQAGVCQPAQSREAIDARVRSLAADMQAAMDQVRDYTMILEMAERSDGKMPRREPLLIKWARPEKLYVKYLREHWGGREVLYIRGKNDDLVKVRNGVFPDVTINLDPRGSIAMDGNHHPVTEVSLQFFINTTVRNLLRAVDRKEGLIEIVDKQTMLGRKCTLIRWKMDKDGLTHIMQDGETLWDVAQRYGSDMNLILHHNRHKGWDEPDDPDEGDRVFVPRYYASRAAVWIDDELKLPVKGQFWDFDGRLYEEYCHRDLRVNVGLGGRDFDPDNPEYGF